MSQFKLIRVAVVLFISMSANAILAQMMQDSLAEVVITDSKIERPIRQTSRPVEVITTATIAQYQGKGLDRLLADQAGVSINGANSNPAGIKNIYVRGAAPGYTLILIDGLPASDASTIGSTIDLRLLDINQVERIEIAKGSQSTLYGSDAIAGVINIITKQGGSKPFSLKGNASLGSWNTADAGLSANGTTGPLQYNVGYQFSSSDGVSEAYDASGADAFEKDGMERQVVSASVKYDLSDKLSIAPSVQVSSFDGDYDGGAFTDGTDTYESDLTNIGVRVNYKSDNFKLNAAYNNVAADRKFVAMWGDFDFEGVTQNGDIYATFGKGDVSFIAGIHYQNASITDASTSEADPSWNIISPYTNLIYLKDQFQLEAGLRLNNHSTFGSNLNYSITPSLFLSDEVKVFASFSTAFKAPALYELYGAFGANPDLDPQTSASFELGSKYYFGQGNVSLTYFNRNVDDVILYTSMYQNFAKQKDEGLEFSAQVKLPEGFDIRASYTYLDGFTEQGGTETDNLYKRPTSQIGVNINYAVDDKLNISVANQYSSDRKDLGFDVNFTPFEANLKSYLRTDVSIQYQAMQSVQLFLHVNNLWDNDFFETYGFTTPGINARVGGVVNLYN